MPHTTGTKAAAQIREVAGVFAYGPAISNLLAGLDECGEKEIPVLYMIDAAARCQVHDMALALLN